MKKRIISGLILALIFIPAFIFGSITFKILIGIISLLMYKEIISLPNIANKLTLPTILFGLISFLVLVYLTIDTYSIFIGIPYQSILLTILLLFLPSLISKKYTTQDALTFIGLIIFLGITMNSTIMIYQFNKMILLYILLIVCLNDIFAYLIGSIIGKTHFTKISPKKTIEGLLGGLICGTIVGAFFYITISPNSKILSVIITSIILSISGQIGDLMFSKIKRENNIKDFSNLIPGHGGILDRLDSSIFAIITYVIIYTIF